MTLGALLLISSFLLLGLILVIFRMLNDLEKRVYEVETSYYNHGHNYNYPLGQYGTTYGTTGVSGTISTVGQYDEG